MIVRTLWDDYFDPVSYTQLFNQQKQDGINATSELNYHVLYSFFVGVKEGGAITYIDKESMPQVLVEYTSFESCFSSSSGASIRFESNGTLVQNTVCHLDSESTSEYNIFVILLPTKSKKKHSFDSCSASSHSTTHRTLFNIMSSSFKFKDSNFSKIRTNGISYMASMDGYSIIKFSTFSNLSMTGGRIINIHFSAYRPWFNVSYCRFIDNSFEYSFDSIIISTTNAKNFICFCCFINNINCEYTFKAHYSDLYVENCYWDGKYSITLGESSLAETLEFPNLNSMFINGVGNCIYQEIVKEKSDFQPSCHKNMCISKSEMIKNYAALFVTYE